MAFFYTGRSGIINIFIYSDESGVFDYIHNDFFVFGGLIFFSKEEKNVMERKFKHAEDCVRISEQVDKNTELKACRISNKSKGKLYRSLNNCYKFGIIINQKSVDANIFKDTRTKQRYLDYAYKITLKKYFKELIRKNIIKSDDIQDIYIFVDEHTTATNGRYELEEGLLNEFKIGTFNYKWTKFYDPIFPNMNELRVVFCDSKSKTLIRAADIIANRIFFLKVSKSSINPNEKLFITYLP